jgi:serine/tyrosine/threonine adenylyltransferase
VPVIAAARGEEDPDVVGQPFMEKAREIFQEKTLQVFRRKMGFDKEADVADDLWRALEPLLRKSRVDWTVFWRQLTYVARDFPDLDSSDYEGMISALEDNEVDERSDCNPFYEPLTPELKKQWISWIKQWRQGLQAAEADGKNVYDKMKTTNPKFVLREWMLVDAYTNAGIGDESSLQELYELIQKPYDEGSDDQIKKFFRRAPERALTAGGTAFMS